MKLSTALPILFAVIDASAASDSIGLDRWISIDSDETSSAAAAFDAYIHDFGKTYESREEYARRQAIFNDNLQTIAKHNGGGRSNYVMGINQFTDQSNEELPTGYDKSLHSAWHSDGVVQAERSLAKKMELALVKDFQLVDLPKELDWRSKGQIVTPVKNQGGCGSCWAFAATAVLESHIALQTGKLFSLSMQELVSCAPNPNECGGKGGCTGSTSELAFDFVSKHGMVEEFSFGYQSYHGKQVNCTILPSDGGVGSLNLRGTMETNTMVRDAVASIIGFSALPTNQYKALMIAIATMGPVAVSVAASGWGLYKGGVYDDDKAETRVLNHAVVLVGYGTDLQTGQDYWLIRNSWGPMWGEDGYIRLKRTDPSNLDDPEQDCKMDNKPADGSACTKDGTGKDIVPKAVSVCGTSGVLFDSSVPIGGHLV